ncbi:MAG: HAD-IA family hydrolase [Actinobacteria bacterium]|nr:HAD-IA family hydrolase [Actinomycetota bacterium]
MTAGPVDLVFDLDGTLSDNSSGIARSINHALVQQGFAPRDESTLHRFIGEPLDEIFAELTAAPGPQIRDCVAAYRDRYGELGYGENRLYGGIAESLRRLWDAGIRMGVCTSKREDFASRIVTLFELDPYFDFVSGADVGISKTTQLAGLLAQGLVRPETAYMIGDREIDIRAGRANGLRTVAVTWGFGAHAELSAAGADLSFDQPSQLYSLAELVRPA